MPQRILFLLFGLFCTAAAAQTPALDVENSAAETLLQLHDDAGLAVFGALGTGAIPATGAGTRLLWYPGKAAFRAGEASSTQWDDASVGTHSVAMGSNTTASGTGATALGISTTASGFQSVALGFGTTASGLQSVAMGNGTEASGTRSTALGFRTTAQAFASLVLGRYNVVEGTGTSWVETDPVLVVGNGTSLSDRSNALTLLKDGGLVLGGAAGTGGIPAEGAGTRLIWYPAKAAFRAGVAQSTQWDDANVGNNSVAMGQSTTASGFASTALGNSTTASGLNATALGQSTTASGDHSTAMGSITEASGTRSTALGRETTASGSASTAMGQNTTASGSASVAMGISTEASGSASVAMGILTTAQAYGSLVIGRHNTLSGSTNSWVSTDPLFVAGIGTSSSPSNALTLLKNGDLTIAGTLTQSSDARLKTGIRPLTGALEAITALHAVRYRFREGTSRPDGEHIGLLAQQVRAVLPELVSEAADGFLSVSYSKLAAVLAAAVSEQQDQIEAQKSQIETLRAEHEDLRAENADLAARLARLETLLAETASARD